MVVTDARRMRAGCAPERLKRIRTSCKRWTWSRLGPPLHGGETLSGSLRAIEFVWPRPEGGFGAFRKVSTRAPSPLGGTRDLGLGRDRVPGWGGSGSANSQDHLPGLRCQQLRVAKLVGSRPGERRNHPLHRPLPIRLCPRRSDPRCATGLGSIKRTSDRMRELSIV